MTQFKITTAILLLFFLHQGLIAQNAIGTIVYGKKFNDLPIETDTVSNSDVIKGIGGLNRRILENIDDVEYTLSFTKNESVFKAIEKMGIEDNIGYKGALLFIKGKGINYLNLEEDIVIEQKESDGVLYNITQKLSDISWSLENETKEIGKYTCYKATTFYKTQIAGKKKNYYVEAWYVPELPIRHGPAGFGNLPGIILELAIDKVTFYMKYVKLKIGKKISRPVGKTVSQKEYDDIQVKLAEEFFNSLD